MTRSANRPTPPRGRIGVLVVNFGEPAEPTLENVESYLERIFLQNVDLEDEGTETAVAVGRARQLATRRAPSLLQDYERIGGSPLNKQADAQADALEEELVARGWNARVYSAFQFTTPSIADKVRAARIDGVADLIVLPVYPICGQSTTVAAIRRAREAIRALDWSPRLRCLSGWHDHPDYASLRAENVDRFTRARGLSLQEPDTLLYFSVHGTPVKYLNEGNRYDRYVDEYTRRIAALLGVGERYAVGFQNHTNRKIEWTQPENEDRIDQVVERQLVVEPVSFMHEQSETLVELDHALRRYVEAKGKTFHRVPVPQNDQRFVKFLADLLTELTVSWDDPVRANVVGRLVPCHCSDVDGTFCTNGARDLPPSPFVARAD